MRRKIDSPLGEIWLAAENGCLTELSFCEMNSSDATENDADGAVLNRAVCQLGEYFRGQRKNFDLPIALNGTQFQNAVWSELRKIPYGATATYAEIARRIGKPKACRAVGRANHVNPIAIIVPCHRVIGADGSLTGYGGGLEKKQYLLSLEKR